MYSWLIIRCVVGEEIVVSVLWSCQVWVIVQQQLGGGSTVQWFSDRSIYESKLVWICLYEWLCVYCRVLLSDGTSRLVGYIATRWCIFCRRIWGVFLFFSVVIVAIWFLQACSWQSWCYGIYCRCIWPLCVGPFPVYWC
jgi:hypothetical protein